MKTHHDDPLPLLEPVQGMTESGSDSDSSNENPALFKQVIHGSSTKEEKQVSTTVAIHRPVEGKQLSITSLTDSSVYAKPFIPRQGMTESGSDPDSSKGGPTLVTQSVSVWSQFKDIHGSSTKEEKVSTTAAIPRPVEGKLSMSSSLTDSSVYAKPFIPRQGMTESGNDSDSSKGNPTLVTQSVSVWSQFKDTHGSSTKERKVPTVAIPRPVEGKISLSSSLTDSSVYAKRFIPRQKQNRWDSLPSTIIVCSPRRPEMNVISDMHHQVLNDSREKRITSSFDPSYLFNLLIRVPESVEYLQSCFRQEITSMFSGRILKSYKKSLNVLTDIARENLNDVKRLELKISSFAELEDNTQYFTIDSIIAERRKSAEYFPSEDRIIQTTPETLAKVCDEIHTVSNGDGGTINDMQKTMQKVIELNGCLNMVTQDYLTKIQMLMDTERLQALEDIQDYDMYSCRFEYVKIPPPRIEIPDCPGCQLSDVEQKSHLQCAYHTTRAYSSDPKSVSTSSIVSTPKQFKKMPRALKLLVGENIIAYLKVPGVAENRPSVCIGDLVRFRFEGNLEVIGEVGEVQVETETIMLFLPAPPSTNTSSYALAVMNSQNKDEVDIKMGRSYRFLNTYAQNNKDVGRFDVRFGLFGSRAHDIFKAIAFSAVSKKLEQVIRVMAPTPLIQGMQKKSERRLQNGISDWAHTLNSEQKHAVFDILYKNHGLAPYCIYGPPGTGKTTTVVESVYQLLRHDESRKILICAPSDTACDTITKRLLPVITDKSKLKRVNWWSRNLASLPPALLGCSSMDESGLFVLPSEEEMKDASIIICQCFVAGCLDSVNTNKGSWMDGHFTHVFVDESSQSFEFESLIPLMKVSEDCSIILAGDPKQLGPSARSQCASRNGLSISLQERLMGLSLYQSDTNYSVITKLLDNYRSHDALLRVPNELFYAGSIQCKASAEVTSTCEGFELLQDGKNFPMMVYDVNDGIEMNKVDTPSFYNIEECHTVMEIIKALLASPNIDINAGNIAVITCFRAQVLKLKEILRKNELGTVNVGVVEDFQGQEMSVVLISTVLTSNQEQWRSGANGGLGFMTNPRRFNVAITRASSLCVIIGKVDYLENSGSYWTTLIEHVRRNGSIVNHDHGDSQFITKGEDDSEDDDNGYGIAEFIGRVEELNLALGSGHELDRYDMLLNGYYQDTTPKWRVCL